MVQCYKDFAGSIRCIECHPTMPLVASCGLDRFLRIHDLQSKHLLHKVPFITEVKYSIDIKTCNI